jgi:hypothetical protein
MESDEFRCAPEGRLRVYRTRNAGASWEPLTRGLPQQGAYETVLREGMVTDSLDPAGIYFGTRSGRLFGSKDEGKSWRELLNGLPQIVCVTCTVVAELADQAPPKPKGKPKPTPRKKPTRSVSKRKVSGAKGGRRSRR